MEVLKIGILKNYLKMGVLKIKFEYWNFEKKILKMEVLKIGILKNYLRTEFF